MKRGETKKGAECGINPQARSSVDSPPLFFGWRYLEFSIGRDYIHDYIYAQSHWHIWVLKSFDPANATEW